MDHNSMLKKKAAERRAELIGVIHAARCGHIGGSLSSVDILTALYECVLNIDPSDPERPTRDRFIMSKGHSNEGYLCVLADKGFFKKSELASYSAYLSRFIGHPSRFVPGVDATTGALGHGLSLGAGMALAAKIKGRSWRTFVLMGDGELAEGSVWEAAMFASAYGLDSLTAIIDRNGLQISGKTESVMPLESLIDKWNAFGWRVIEADGHDIAALASILNMRHAERPAVVIAHTIKGKGISFMENDPAWHHRVPGDEEYAQALRELGASEVIL